MFVIAVAALFIYVQPSSALPALEELERKSGSGPEVLEALAASARDSYLEQLEGQRAGGKWFLNGSIGYSDEPQYDTSENSIHYTKFSVSAGLSFPLFGTWDKLKINKLSAEIKAADSKYKSQILRVNNLAALRKAYAVLWIEAQKIRLAKAFLSNKEYVASYLSQRRQKALLRPSDNLEFLAAYDMAKKDIAVSQLHMVQAMQIIRLDTGEKWQMPDDIAAPTLPVFYGVSADVDSNPSVAMRFDSVKKYEKLADASRRIDNEGHINFGLNAGKDIPGDFGTGIYASIVLTGPLKEIGREDKAKLAAKSDLERAKQEENFTRMKVEGDAEEALSMAAYASANISAQYARLRSIAQGVTENYLRHQEIAGDTFEKLQSTRYQYYRVAMDMLDSQLILLQSGADILAAAYPQGNESEPHQRNYVVDGKFLSSVTSQKWFTTTGKLASYSGPSAPAVDAYQPPQYTYIWKAAPFLDTHRRDGLISALHSRGINDIFISFTGKELAGMKTSEGSQKLNDLLRLAKNAGINAELMLAEPTWLYPENRHEMIEIINSMSKFKFSGVHLDIEPDQIKGAVNMRPKMTDMLVATIREAAASTQLPISFSAHPRYLEGALGTALDSGLRGVKISCIVPMIYAANADNTANRMSAILAKHPRYNFVLAQSVEKKLPSTESYYTFGVAGFKKSVTRLESKLMNSPNFKGIAVQAWEDYEVLR